MTAGAPNIAVQRIELDPPQATPRGTFRHVWAVTVTVGGAGGASGRARALTRERAEETADALAQWCADADVSDALARSAASARPLDDWRTAWLGFEARASAGPSFLALAALDGAVWCRARRAADRHASQHVDTAVYWSGLWLHSSVTELAAEVAWAAGQGFDAAKLRVDGTAVGSSVDRIRAVIDAAPPGRWVALELASSGTVDDVAAIVDAIDAERVLWIEDPVPTTDVAAMAELARRLPVAIATGEDCWGRDAFVERVRAVAARVPIIDLGYTGGPTALSWLLEERTLGRLDVGVHVDALAGAEVAAVTPGVNRVWLEVFPWWDSTTRADVAAALSAR
jgi:L-alanine-DL-glutamate epimerase-like enolase superfamily enzyme